MKKCDRPDSFLAQFCLFLVVIAFSLQAGCASQVEKTTPPEPEISSSQPSPTETGKAETKKIPAIVETVEVRILESSPPQLSLTVTGSFQDGCEAPLAMEQKQEGDRITIVLYRELPVDIFCPEVLVPFQETVRLEGDFASGTYTLDVNGIVKEESL